VLVFWFMMVDLFVFFVDFVCFEIELWDVIEVWLCVELGVGLGMV